MAQMGFGRLVVNSLFTSVIIVLFITSGLIVNALWTIILPLWFAGRRDLYRACCKHITTAWFRSKSKHLPDCPRTIRALPNWPNKWSSDRFQLSFLSLWFGENANSKFILTTQQKHMLGKKLEFVLRIIVIQMIGFLILLQLNSIGMFQNVFESGKTLVPFVTYFWNLKKYAWTVQSIYQIRNRNDSISWMGNVVQRIWIFNPSKSQQGFENASTCFWTFSRWVIDYKSIFILVLNVQNIRNLVGSFCIQKELDLQKKNMKRQSSLLVRNKFNQWDNILYLDQKAFMNSPQGT